RVATIRTSGDRERGAAGRSGSPPSGLGANLAPKHWEGARAMTSDSITAEAPAWSSPRIADLVELTATRLPEAAALVVTADRVPVSYRELVRLVDDLAGQLTRAGLLPGDRVALRAGSNPEFVVALLAASRADLVLVPLDPALPVSEQRTRTEAAG